VQPFPREMGGLLIYIGKHDSSRINTFRFNSGPLGNFSPALEKGAVLKDNRKKKKMAGELGKT
jgi:hypothetical protein